MSAADTARLIASLELQDKLSPGVTTALGSVNRLEGGLGRITTASGKVGGALNHAKGAIGGLLTGPLGILGLAGGVGGLGIGIEKVISHTNDFAFSVEKLTNLTGGSAESMSTLLAVFEKFNIDAQRTGQIVGFAEKTLGNLAKTTKNGTSKLAALDAAYGLHLVDSKGKLVDYETELKQVADVYISNIEPSKKAALAAQLFGRGYSDLVPILALGSKGISDAEQAAKDLGLTLTAQNAKDLKQYRESLRDTADAIGGLELQLGLALVPAIKDMADAITSFLRNGGREKLVGFFKQALSAAQGLAGFVTGTLVPVFSTIAGAAKTAWDAIPEPLRNFLITGLVADKTIKFLFGFDPASSALGALKEAFTNSVAKGLIGAGIGKLFVQPVFVTNPGFGLPGGLPAAAAEGAAVEGAAGAGLAATALPLAVIAASIVGPIVAQQKISSDLQITAYNEVSTNVQKEIQGGASLADLQKSMSAVDQGINDIQSNPLNMIVGGQALDELKANRANLQKAIDAINLAGRDTIGGIDQAAVKTAAASELGARRIEAAENRTGNLVDSTGKVIRKQAAASTLAFKALEKQLRDAKTGAQIRAGLKAADTTIFGKSLGNADATRTVLGELKADLKAARTIHDPKLEASLRTEISKVEHKLVGRQLVADQLKKAQQILHSSESTKQKIVDLKAVETAIGHRSQSAIQKVKDAIAVAQRAQVIASKLAGHEAAAAIRDKDLSVKVIANVTTNISSRSFTKTLATSTKFGNPG